MSPKKPLKVAVLNRGAWFDSKKQEPVHVPIPDNRSTTSVYPPLVDWTSQIPSHFLFLAPEVRLLIYEFLFEGSRIVVQPDRLANVFVYWRNETPNLTNILEVNKLIRSEALLVLRQKTNILRMSDVRIINRNKWLTLTMPDEWRSCIETIEYENIRPGVNLYLPIFPNLRTISIGVKTCHVEEAKKPAPDADFDTLSTLILSKIQHQYRSLFNYTQGKRWVSDAPHVKVTLQVWLLNRRLTVMSPGWEANVDLLNWHVLSIRQAMFNKIDYQPDTSSVTLNFWDWYRGKRVWTANSAAWRIHVLS